MARPVIVAGARTPIGKMHGSLGAPAGGWRWPAWRSVPRWSEQGSVGSKSTRSILGHVVQAGAGPNPARLGAAAGGIPMGVPATTVNKLCLVRVWRRSRRPRSRSWRASPRWWWPAATESMSNAPYLLSSRSRGAGLRYGDTPRSDALDQDALACGFDGIPMGAATERYQAGLGISREDQDAVRRRVARQGRGGDEGGPPGRGDRAWSPCPGRGGRGDRRGRRGAAGPGCDRGAARRAAARPSARTGRSPRARRPSCPTARAPWS